jgi:putative spermidine/putrescine transport system substrate-binding protein
MSKQNNGFTRRKFLSGAAMVGAASFAPAFIKDARAADTLKVGTYGGYFEESFVKYNYP